MSRQLCSLLIALLVGCTHAVSSPPSEAAVVPESAAPESAAPTVDSAPLAVAPLLNGKQAGELLVEGSFMGFQGPCSGAPPTRSAWHLVDAQGAPPACIYVAGPLAEGTRSMPAEGIGSRVRVRGTLRELDGVRYLEAREVSR